MTFKKIAYEKLNSRQKENYNFHRLAAVLVEHGYTTLMRLSDDWNGADLIAQHREGKSELRIQLKSRLTFSKKYLNKGIWIAFPDWERKKCYLYPHDILLRRFGFQRTRSWANGGHYSFKSLSCDNKKLLEKYALFEE